MKRQNPGAADVTGAIVKRRGFMGLAGATGVASAAPLAASEEGGLIKSPPVLMAPRADGAEVVWAVGASALGRVEWQGGDGTSGTATADRYGMAAQGDEVLRVRLEGLRPDVSYRFRTVTTAVSGGRTVPSRWKTFRTLDPAAGSTRFVVWNDTHEHEETLRALDDRSPKADFLIWNGDTCNDWHREEDLARVLLSPGGRDFTDGRPLVPVWGNHDVRGRWAYRVPEFLATPDRRPYQAFRSGPLAVVCLHTGEDKPDGHPSFGGRVAFEPFRREQADWLRQVVRTPAFRDAPYRVVFCHIPLRWKTEPVLEAADYGNGRYDHYSRTSREAWHDVLVDWGAQVVVSGHTHQVAWLPGNEEFPYAQLTGGGPQPDRATWIEGVAGADQLTLKVRGLDGETREQARFEPLA